MVLKEYDNIRLCSEQVTEFPYQPGKCRRPYRVIVLRKNLSIEKGERKLFDKIRYFFYRGQPQPVTTAAILRQQEYWTLLSGGAGQLYGSAYTWTFTGGWQGFLASPGAVQMANVQALFEPRAWYDQVPDQARSVLTAGHGTWSDVGYVADNDFATAARTPDGSLVVAYMPTLRTLTVDMGQLAAPAVARWYDPSLGVYRAIAGSPFLNSGTLDFTPPGPNGAGDGDWVLVVEARPPEPILKAFKRSGADCVLWFETLRGVGYTIERTDDVKSGAWSEMAGSIPGTGGAGLKLIRKAWLHRSLTFSVSRFTMSSKAAKDSRAGDALHGHSGRPSAPSARPSTDPAVRLS